MSGRRAVLFDCGDTLATLSSPREELFLAAARAAGTSLDLPAVRRAYLTVDFAAPHSSLVIDGDGDREAFYRDFNRRLCAVLGISGSFDRIYPLVAARFRKARWVAAPGALPVLAALHRQGVPTAVVANWDRTLPRLIDNLGLGACVDCVVSSREAGVEKPDPRIFGGALRKLGLSPEVDRVFYVGNDYRLDVLSARAAGLHPVLIDRGGDYPFADCERHASLTAWLDAFAHGAYLDPERTARCTE